jgi:hypothetical protein
MVNLKPTARMGAGRMFRLTRTRIRASLLTLSPASTSIRCRGAARSFAECMSDLYLHDKPPALPTSYAAPPIDTGYTRGSRGFYNARLDFVHAAMKRPTCMRPYNRN